MATKLILIRHGQTSWNLEKKYSGYIDIGLNDHGKVQAKLLSKRLKEETIHTVYASDRKRALQTARIIFKKMRINKVPQLREMHFGIFEGLTHKQLLAEHTRLYKKWLDDPYSVSIPKGEKTGDFKRRVVAALQKIIRVNKNKTVAVVCHGGAISIYITHLLKTRNFWEHIPKSASISVIEYAQGKAAIQIFNDITHLS
jgi:phosphoserine phosphatase